MRYKITLNRVHDLIEVREGNETLVLRVDADPSAIVRKINKLEPKLEKINTGGEQDAEQTAKELSTVFFGEQQSKMLFDLYNGNAACVLGLCGKYFANRLNKIILKTQRKAKL